MGKVKSSLDDLVLVTPVSDIKAKATDGARLAGVIRVFITNGGTFGTSPDVAALRSDINALDAACTAAGK